MTTRQNLWKKLPLLLLISGAVITAAVAQSGAGPGKTTHTDTVPKKQKQVRDLDEALQELDKGEAELQKAFQEFDGEKIGREIRDAMKNMEVDLAKAKAEMEKAVKEFDAQKINLEVQKAMVEVQKALKEIDAEKIKADVQASLAKVDTEKMKAELEKAKAELEKVKDVDFDKVRKELAAVRPEVERALRDAKKDLELARQELTAYRNLVNALDKDGYLQKQASYKVEYKNGELTVNGKKLSSDVVKKYSEFLQGKKDFTLNKDDDNFNINK